MCRMCGAGDMLYGMFAGPVSEIYVRTACGMSDSSYVGDCIGQGAAGAALVSKVNLDQGLQQYFGDGGRMSLKVSGTNSFSSSKSRIFNILLIFHV